MISFFKKRPNSDFSSQLFDENGFYKKFLKDLETCQSEVIIESPYVTSSRMEVLLPVFQRLLHNKIKIKIVTRDPSEHENELFRHQATNEILVCKDLGVDVQLQTGFHHRKLAVIDKAILWEGSLNILSYSKSKEIMRRLEGGNHAQEMLEFLKL